MGLKGTLPREVLKMSLDSILANKFRSFLTVLGIVVGIITAIVVAALLLGLRGNIVDMIEDYGTNNIYAFHLTTGFGPPNREERSRKPLTVDDAEAIMAQSNAIEDVAVVAPSIGSFGDGFDDNLLYEGKNYRWAATDGVTPNYQSISNLTLREGRFITRNDNQQRRHVLVIGVNAADALFPGKEGDIVGKMVRMNSQMWEIIGVIEKRKSGFFGENDEDRKVMMPIRTARKVAPQRDYLLHIIKAKQEKIQDALDDAESVLRQRRNVKFGEPNNFDIKTADAFIEQFDSIMGAIGLAAIAISCLGLLVGGIGVMNIMLVSVTERTKEIGIRKAIGATKSAIIFQFLFEAMTLTFFGGLLGVVLAVGISQLIMFLVPSLPAVISLGYIVFALTVSVLVGLVFGVLPARKAAQLDPIECLRYE
ncbi:MAG: ABC transporter permease [Acidobacteriota bacterium]|nr:ABC transporter permease [Acidobacteriota bacterium]MDH3528460.1 ABC transporter permease [Acidobacteriota bacterium]